MIGLYILSTNQLEKDKTVKFGMSMRLEYRWIDYQVIFNDSKYLYYYEFLDNLTREEILDIEKEILQIHRNERNSFYQTEYFYCNDYKIFNQSVINILNKNNINYMVHDIHNFIKDNYDNKPEPFEFKEEINKFKPYSYQQEVLDKIEIFYDNNNIGKIIWSCGLGKALLAILIVQKLNYKKVIIGVPTIYLQKQMKNEIMKIFNNNKNILYVGGKYTNKEDIKTFINKKSFNCKFIITTYDSCHKLLDIKFDFKIGDEAHHLVGSESEKTKDNFHKIKSKKSLFMTATEKIIENNKNNKVLYSMDDKDLFGEVIDIKTINWSIENRKITDYNLIIIKNTEEEIDNIISSLILNNDETIDKNLFLSAYISLKSIEKYNDLSHILIYTNKTENAELVEKYIDIILKLDIVNLEKDNYYNKALHSKNSKNSNDGEITKFKKASWGIISSVYIFGEGFDCPSLNGVVFSENMESDIRIVQSTLRPNRLDNDFPNKKAYIIIPYIDTENFLSDNESFDKCRKIICKIRNVDEKVEQKINVVSLGKSDRSKKEKEKEKDKIEYNDIIENGNELTKIMLRLRYSKALDSKQSEEQDEFNYVKQLNKELNIKSKEEYIIVKNKHKNYIENPEEYFKLKGVWSNWYDYIGYDTKKFIQDKNNWINFCKENNIKSLEDYNNLCESNDNLPYNPADFYIDFVSIPIELGFYNKRRR